MQLTAVDENGAVLIYRSSRSGFSKYLMGQLYEIAKTIYDLNLKIKVLESENDVPGSGSSSSENSDLKQVLVKYRLDFDNKEYVSETILCEILKDINKVKSSDGTSRACIGASISIGAKGHQH